MNTDRDSYTTAPSYKNRLGVSVSLNETEALRLRKAKPNAAFSFTDPHGSGESNRFHGHVEGRVAFPMDGLGSKGCGSNNLNISEFGGEPFYMHMGKVCHRGAHPFKKPDHHPSETAKRIFYREDGSGRDGYIMSNNGGLTVSKTGHVFGDDIQTRFAG